MQKYFCLKIIFLFLANFIFVVSHFKNTPSCPFKYSEVIVVKKKNLLKVY